MLLDLYFHHQKAYEDSLRGGREGGKKSKSKPTASRDERDIVEMLSIIITTGIIHNGY